VIARSERAYLSSIGGQTPDVTQGFTPAGISVNRQGGHRVNQNISVAGMRGTWNNCTLDGLADTDPDFNVYIRIPSIEALQEFKVVSGIYPAEFGREVAQINGSAKSGTNDFRVPSQQRSRREAVRLPCCQSCKGSPLSRQSGVLRRTIRTR
jgi:hypothetical protein